MLFNSLQADNYLDKTKFKAFADNKLNVAKIMIYVFDGGRKHCGKRRNAGYQHFLLFPHCFQKASFLGSLKLGINWQRVNNIFKVHYFS